MRAFYQKYELLSMITAGMQIMRSSPPATLKIIKARFCVTKIAPYGAVVG